MKTAEKLLDYLESLKPKKFSVVVMPDFFLDRFVSLEHTLPQFCNILEKSISRKGGALDGYKQFEFRGGNAVNTAAALAALGAKVYPIIHTSKLGKQLIKYYLEPLNVDLSYIDSSGRLSITTALEFPSENGKINVMLRDLGSLEDFGPANLTEREYELIEKSDYVCVFNWAGTRRYGTELAKNVFQHVKNRGKGKTYYDPADPSPNKEKIPQLVKEVLLSDLVDVLSLNENEAVCYGSQMEPEIANKVGKVKLEELAMEAAETIAKHVKSRIDLHTTVFSASFKSETKTVVPAFNVKVLRATGAGDAWNAGNIFADFHNFPDDIRLTFANAVAAYYISNPEAKHPTLKNLESFCRRILGNEKTC